MDPLLAAGLVSAGIKGAKGISQGIKAKRLSKRERPKYTRPSEITKYISSAKTRAADTKLAGQNLLEQKLGKSGSDYMEAVKEAGSPADVIRAAGAANRQKSSGMVDIGIAASQDYQKRQREKDKALLLGAEYSDKEFSANKMQPYQQAKASESALREASFKNLKGAGSDLLSLGTDFLQQKQLDKDGEVAEDAAVKSGDEVTDVVSDKPTNAVTTDVPEKKDDVSGAGGLPEDLKTKVRRGIITLADAIKMAKIRE